jgi:hypothetical protein
METLDITPGKSQMPQGTSRPGSNHMTLGSRKPHSHKRIVSLPLDVVPDSSQSTKAMTVEHVSLYLWTLIR